MLSGGAWFNTELKGAKLGEERWTLSWSPDRPTTIDELPFLERSAPRAQADGIKVELALYGRPASNNDPTAFCEWAANVAATVSKWGIHDYIVWNEPNTALYWSPQDDDLDANGARARPRRGGCDVPTGEWIGPQVAASPARMRPGGARDPDPAADVVRASGHGRVRAGAPWHLELRQLHRMAAAPRSM